MLYWTRERTKTKISPGVIDLHQIWTGPESSLLGRGEISLSSVQTCYLTRDLKVVSLIISLYWPLRV